MDQKLVRPTRRYIILSTLGAMLLVGLSACSNAETEGETDRDSTSTEVPSPDTTSSNRETTPREASRLKEVDIASYFTKDSLVGSFILYDLESDTTFEYNSERNDRRFLPASTFKVFNSLVAIETGAVADEREVIAWDSVDRSIAQWNQDHDLRSAITFSVVWFYQELARRIGREKMQEYIDATGYGNRDISGPIDRFWLDGELKITPREQIAMLVRLHREELPFSKRSHTIVKDIMTLDSFKWYTYRGKTGWALRERDPEENVGWFIGYVEVPGHTYFVALTIEMRGESDLRKRTDIAYDILQEAGAFVQP